jgi:hypothetical protein
MKTLLAYLITVSMLCALVMPPTPAAGQSVSTVRMNPCQFSVGFGEAKHEVDAQCGAIQVPEDRSKPDGRKLDIHFVLLAATGKGAKGTPIFHLEGGPGGSAISGFGEAWYSAFRVLRETHDIVLIDQRGTGRSASLQCKEVTDPAFEDLAQPLTDREAQDLYIDRLSACLNRLSATNDPAFYTSTILADDTDAVREALGFEQIDIFSNSYGTWLDRFTWADTASMFMPWCSIALSVPGITTCGMRRSVRRQR